MYVCNVAIPFIVFQGQKIQIRDLSSCQRLEQNDAWNIWSCIFIVDEINDIAIEKVLYI